jgi:hypothetical protein
MPHRNAARFLDENLQPLAIDLYDPAVWKHYGWSPINNADFRRQYENKNAHATTGKRSLADLDGYFVAALDRARRFHEALDVVVDRDAPVVLLAIGADCEETLNAPIVMRDEKRNRWVTLVVPRDYRTSSGQRISRQQAADAMSLPGDGRVTRSSLLGEGLVGDRRVGNAFNSPLPISGATFFCDLHGALQKNKTMADNALTALVSEAMK